tara:strand:- start:1321 stop:1674 length:354 start_codon:yes stop_codon:yes gene_type:complete
MKVVINNCCGEFGLSQEALRGLHKRLTPDSELAIDVGIAYGPRWRIEVEAPSEETYDFDIFLERDDPQLVGVVEELRSRANGSTADLKIVKIPDGVDYVIEDYDGDEWISEVHRTWP